MGVLGKEVTRLASGCDFGGNGENEKSRTMSRLCLGMWVAKSQHESFRFNIQIFMYSWDIQVANPWMLCR